VPTTDSVDDPLIAIGSALHSECPLYCDLVRQALTIKAGVGFGDVEALDAFRLTGPDNEGRPVFMFIPGAIPENEETAALVEKLTLYVLSIVHDLVVHQQKHFTAIWMCNNHSESRPLSIGWFRRTYRSVPYCYHERLAGLCLVHPSLTVRCMLFVLSYLPRVSFWDKLNYCDRLEFLDGNVPVSLIKTVPQLYKDYDKQLDRDMYEASSQMAAGNGLGSGIGGIGGMGMSGMGMSGVPGMPGSVPDMADGAPDDQGGQQGQPKMELPKRNWEMD